MPLVRGHYPLSNAAYALTGNVTNTANPTSPARSNLEWFSTANVVDGALATTGVGTVVAVPVEPGTVVTSVTMLVGATAAVTPTHAFVGLYGWHATAPPLIAQSTDTTTAAIAASAAKTYTLTTPTRITPTHAPYGYIYVSYVQTGTTISTAVSATTTTAVSYKWFSTGPITLSGTSGSGMTDTAEATLTLTAKAVAPLLFLR